MENQPTPEQNQAPTEPATLQPAPVPEVQQPAQPLQPLQPQPAPVKKPMPKWLLPVILGSVGAVALIICAIIFIPMMLKIDYASSFRTTREVRDKLSNITSFSSCKDAVSDVENIYISVEYYDKQITECENKFNELNDYIKKLGETDIVKKDNDIKNIYNDLKKEVDSVTDNKNITDTLSLWSAYHAYSAGKYGNSQWFNYTDSELDTIVTPLLNSGNDTLKKYGEGYKEVAKPYIDAQAKYVVAYSEYYQGDKTRSELDEISKVGNEAHDILFDYVKNNKPNIQDLAPFTIPDASNIDSIFRNLYHAVEEKYKEHYDEKDGLCSKISDQIICQ